MVTRWFLNGLLIVTVVVALVVAGLWWWSVQTPRLDRAVMEDTTLTLDNGLTVRAVSDPDTPDAHLSWHWDTGTLSDPEGFPGQHQLFSRVLLYGETPTGYRHLETRAERDPQGQVGVHTDRTHTRVDYHLSPSALADEVHYFARLLQFPSLPLESIAYERAQLTGLDDAFGFLSLNEARALSDIQQANGGHSLIHNLEAWSGMSNEAIARQLAQYADDRLLGNAMTVTLRGPQPLSELTDMAESAFGDQRAGEVPSPSDLSWQPLYPSLSDALYQPVSGGSVAVGQIQQVPSWRVMIPWRLSEGDQREDAATLVHWLNAHYENGPGRQLREAGLIDRMSARHNDEYLVLDIEPTSQGEDEEAVIHSTLALFLAQLQNDDSASTRITRIAGERRVAPELRLTNLAFDPTLMIVLDNDAPGSAQSRTVPEPDPMLALNLNLPQSFPERTTPSVNVDGNPYELLGWQPQLMMDTEGVTLWHYEDNRFGSLLASAHIRVHFPVGRDEQHQDQWQRWAEQQAPGWTDRIIWTDHAARSPAQGLKVSVDEKGVTWHYTDVWTEVEPWLYEFVQSLEGQSVDLPDAQPSDSEPHRLLRERAQLPTVTPPEDLGRLPNTVLLSGRVATDDAVVFGEWLDERRAPDTLDEPEALVMIPEPLAQRNQFAELEFSDDRSLVTRVSQLPANNLRQNTLAEWSLPWIQEALTMAVREQDFAGEMNISLQAPLGHPGLEVRLSSAEQDPARQGLYLQGFWQTLDASVDGFDQNRFQSSTQRRADLLRDSAWSLPALANAQWDDITAERTHFNGRVLQARALEGTNIEGWQYFMRQWLFDGNARQLNVYEIGEPWQADYQDARQLPVGSERW